MTVYEFQPLWIEIETGLCTLPWQMVNLLCMWWLLNQTNPILCSCHIKTAYKHLLKFANGNTERQRYVDFCIKNCNKEVNAKLRAIPLNVSCRLNLIPYKIYKIADILAWHKARVIGENTPEKSSWVLSQSLSPTSRKGTGICCLLLKVYLN